jgi:two-component system OmpR family sensor kinase
MAAMPLLRSLAGRLTVTYAAALLICLGLFAVVSSFFLLRLSAAVLDARLRATAAAATAIAVDSGDGLQLDPGDAQQFTRVVTTRLDGALVRSNGQVVVTTSAGVPPEIVLAAARITHGMNVETIATREDQLRVAASAVVQRGRRVGAVIVWESTNSLDEFKRLIITVFGIGIPLFVGLAVLSAGYVTRRGLAPLRDIAQLASEIEARDLSRRLRPHSEHDELGSLSATFDRMLDRLQEAFVRQRQFTADGSHELRGPLTIIRAEADLALRQSRDTRDYRLALESIANEADRLEALIEELLTLARAEAGPPRTQATVDLTPLVADAARRLAAVAQVRGISVELTLAQDAFVRGDPEAIARVPLALMENAIKYAADGGRVQVILSRDAEGRVELRVRDDGPGFSDSGLRRATERFWRDDQARGRGGAGLGLSIVRAIAEQTDGTIELRNAPGGGAEVIVRFAATIADNLDLADL